MSDTKIDEHNLEENIWIHGKPVANLASSEMSMSDERKAFIKEALKYDIIDIRTYAGYKGDLITEVTTMDAAVVPQLKAFAEDREMDLVYHKDVLSIYKIYAISPVENVYELKEDD